MLNDERVNLAGAAIPTDLPSELQLAVKRAIGESFVAALRLASITGGALALASALVAALLIDGRDTGQSQSKAGPGHQLVG